MMHISLSIDNETILKEAGISLPVPAKFIKKFPKTFKLIFSHLQIIFIQCIKIIVRYPRVDFLTIKSQGIHCNFRWLLPTSWLQTHRTITLAHSI